MIDAASLAFALAGATGAGTAAVGGFLLGYRYARSAPNRLLARDRHDRRRVVAEARHSIELAGRLCEAAGTAPGPADLQLGGLVEAQDRLVASIERLRSPHAPAPAAQHQFDSCWLREPTDAETGLPGRAAFEANLATLLTAEPQTTAGILIVSLDGTDRLRRRVGDRGLAEIRRTMARLLCRFGRDGDLACRFEEHAFALLVAGYEPEDALRHTAAVRDALRGHPFRLGDAGAEVFVTASLGFTPVLPGDETHLVIDRALAAVARSRRWGRNRLSACDPRDSRPRAVPEATESAVRSPAPAL